ncbi:lipocalin family protein [uncultured Microscilla sp.]|uniref:lipocalin family protein n=1 Tax=uncultured Microscilla sp. TaxID=432653 RepID=UPI00262010F7|nr:lipocalin family protein [uncultured Microscilla sp.]
MKRKNVWKACLMVCFNLLLLSCGPSQYENTLAKKWKPSFDPETEIKKRAKQHYAKMGKKHVNKLKQGIAQKTAQMVYEFKPDGKYRIVFEKDGEPEVGTWKVIEDGKVLFIKSDRGKQQKITIKSLTANKVVLSIDENTELVLLPA